MISFPDYLGQLKYTKRAFVNSIRLYILDCVCVCSRNKRKLGDENNNMTHFGLVTRIVTFFQKLAFFIEQ